MCGSINILSIVNVGIPCCTSLHTMLYIFAYHAVLLCIPCCTSLHTVVGLTMHKLP